MGRPFLVRRNLARLLLRLARWRTVGTVPQRAVLVGAPHTSNWDWVLTMLLAWDNDIQIKLLVKKEFFVGPLAPILRATGAISIDRSSPGDTIKQLMAQAAGDEPFVLGLAAEGTRSRGEYWKSGFYRMAQQTGLPVALGFVDGPTRTIGFGPSFHPSGDVVADMDLVRAFYADKHGIRPALRTEPRLRDEASR